MSSTLRKYTVVPLLLVLLVGAFGYGTLVGRLKIFPYYPIRNAYVSATEGLGGLVTETAEKAVGREQRHFSQSTLLLPVEGEKYNLVRDANLSTFAAALTRVGDRMLGVDGNATFFRYRSGGNISKLDVALETNRDRFLAYLEENDIEVFDVVSRFRVLDITTLEADSAHLFASYHYWDPQNRTKTIRVARLPLDDVIAALNGASVDAEQWEVIYESQPPIQVGSPPYGINHPMFTRHTGGRLAVRDDSTLFLSLGDYRFDGIRNTPKASQVDSSSYGKIIRIDLHTFQSTHFAKGVRNPQGLHVDRKGRIWETEHGPYGGDELNLIQKDENYGWPFVTYGRWFSTYTWPYGDRVGWHKGYEYPYHVWEPGTGISNLIQVREGPERWDGDLLVSSLAGRSLFRIRVRDERVLFAERIEVERRIRDLEQMANGSFLLYTDKNRFIELRPVPTDTVRDGDGGHGH